MNSYVNDFTPTVRTYYKELKKYNPLPKSRERDLIHRAKRNDDLARNELLSSNLKFVFDVAKKYKGKGVALDDLIAEGNLGLVKALDKFDESQDVKFISYAVFWVRQSIQECIKKRKSQQENETSEDEYLDGLKEKTLHKSLSHDGEEIDTSSFKENLLTDIDDVTIKEAKKTKKILINKLLKKLDKRSEFIIKTYYGIDCNELGLEEIGDELGITKERVRQIKDKSLRILKSEILMIEDISDILR